MPRRDSPRMNRRTTAVATVAVCLSLFYSTSPAAANDPAYGAYLASECVTCHRADGASHGIPVIAGMSAESFTAAMAAYRDKSRPNQVMQTIAGQLSDTDVAALAAYFSTISQDAPRGR